MKAPEKKSFWALMVAQFFSAFNDNVLKTLVTLLIVEWIATERLRNSLVDLSGVVFVAPFLLFSMIAGRISDRMSKSRVVVGVKIWELLVVAVAIYSLTIQSIVWMMIALFLLSMQAAFFSPAKYGILPELMGEAELSDGNGLLNMWTFVAILVGTASASFLAAHLNWARFVLGAASVTGLIASLFMESLPAAKPDEPIAWNPARWMGIIGCLFFLGWLQTFAHVARTERFWAGIVAGIALLGLAVRENAPDLFENWRIIRQDRTLKLSVIAVNYFWLVGAIFQLNIFLYAKVMMNASLLVTGILVCAATVGIGLGSFLAGRLSEGKVELGLVPMGALGMSVFAIDLMFAHRFLPRALIDSFMMGISGGFYEVPLNALVQWRSPPGERGRVLATQNFLSFLAILAASGVLLILGSALRLNPAQVFFTLGILSLIGIFTVYYFLPDALWRLVLYVLTNTVYRLRIVGGENVPMKGPALLVANHLSLADGFLVGGALPRLVQFLIWRPYDEAPGLRWLAKALKCIPISEKDPPEEILRSLLAARKVLEDGGLVCLFAEGQVSRTGNLLEFKRGFEVIVKGMEVPVIPVNLDRVWGSLFSFEHGKVVFKRPRRIPYPVTVTFGVPLKPPVQAAQGRQAVVDLGNDAFAHRLGDARPLPAEFLRRAKRYPGRLAVADSSGQKLSYGRLAALSVVLARHLDKILTVDECVGILLPASVGGVLANLAVSLGGRIPVNLNYIAGPQTVQQAVQKAGVSRMITSRKLLEKTGLPATSAMIFLEDVLALLPPWEVGWERVLFSILPSGWVLKRSAARAPKSVAETATIMFSSGSTGIPKGVMLSHTNILANVLSLSQVFDVGPQDRMLGVLPFFDPFGYTGTVWFPLLCGFGAVYHSNPLEAKGVGELAEKYSATMLLATPTFLLAYTRQCTPEQFRRLRYVIVGAERLRDAIAKSFEEKFGKVPLEGYGCTELSPVATVNVPDISMGEVSQVGRKSGKIGHPIPGVSVRIVDPETFQPLPQGAQGLMLVKGPNVMKGYLDEPEKTTEALRDGWYITGDIARVDNDGFLQIVDRLTRFSKIGAAKST